MIPQPPEFFDLFSTDHQGREALAAAERLRGPGSLRLRTAANGWVSLLCPAMRRAAWRGSSILLTPIDRAPGRRDDA